MYQTALSEKVANNLKLVPDACRPSSKISPLDRLVIWLKNSFTFDDDECKKYHQNMLVDSMWEVSPLQVLNPRILFLHRALTNLQDINIRIGLMYIAGRGTGSKDFFKLEHVLADKHLC